MDSNFYTCPDCKECMPRLRKMNHINKECPAKKSGDSNIVPLFNLLLGKLLDSDAYQSHVSNSKDSKKKMDEEKKSEIVKEMREMSKKINTKSNDFDERFSKSIKNSDKMKKEVEDDKEFINNDFVDGMVKALQVAAFIQKLPSGEIQDPEKLQPNDKKCFLCKQEFQKGDKIIILPCRHIFHDDHIANFLLQRMCCPICSFLKEMNILVNLIDNLKDNEEE